MALERSQIEEAAAFLFHLGVQGETASALPFEIAPKTLEDAYAIQDAVHDTAGWPIAMLKVGCTSEIAQQMLSIPHPIGGRVPAELVFDSGAELPRSLFASEPMIECEVACRVDASGAIVAVAPAIELIAPRVQAGGTFGGVATVADNAGNAAVVLGTEIPVENVGSLDDIAVELFGGDELIATGHSQAVMGGPAASVEWTLDHEASRLRSVLAETWIITGTCSGLTPSTFGVTYSADFGNLGSVSYSTTA